MSGERSRLVVWAHNAHIGDIRATSRGDAGRISLGQLLRERYPDDTFSVGLMSATGTVRAALVWGGPDRVMTLTPPLRESHAALLQRARAKQFYVVLDDASTATTVAFDQPRLQRGIGVRYVKRYERPGGHYYSARLRRQYDAVLFIEHTRALRRVPRPPRASRAHSTADSTSPARGKPRTANIRR